MSIDQEFHDLSLTRDTFHHDDEDNSTEMVEIEALTPEDLIDLARYNEVEVLQAIAASEHVAKLAGLDEKGNTLLHMAAANGHLESIQLLLDALAPFTQPSSSPASLLNAQNCEGNTALHWAALNGQAAAVQVLLAAGADLNLQNAFNRNAFDEAVAREKFEVTAVIIEFMEQNKKAAAGAEEVDGEVEGGDAAMPEALVDEQ